MSKIIELSQPIKIFSAELQQQVEVSELELKPLKGKHIMNCTASPAEINAYSGQLIAASAGLSITEVGELSGVDFFALQAEVMSFLAGMKPQKA